MKWPTYPRGWPVVPRLHVRFYVLTHDRFVGVYRTSFNYEALYHTAVTLFRADQIGHWSISYADMPRHATTSTSIPRGLLRRGRNVR